MTPAFTIKNPKRSAKPRGRESWYPYYAGFSGEFVEGLLGSVPRDRLTRILDPWNGSGTTTTLADQLGFAAVGFDLNPAMVVAAKGKLLSSAEFPSLLPLAANMLKIAGQTKFHAAMDGEPLETWFTPTNARMIRQIEQAIQQHLVNAERYTLLTQSANIGRLSQLACFFYLALFRTLRRILGPFVSSNPTWIRVPEAKRRIRPTFDKLSALFMEEITEMIGSLGTEERDSGKLPEVATGSSASFSVASSCALPAEENSVDLIITSPPYCTRIDYAVATLPELTLLGYDLEKGVDAIRRNLIGTSTVPKVRPEPAEAWGIGCNEFLDRVRTHPSKASATYYLKNHLHYFDRMYLSIGELARVCKPQSRCVLVVQDSYYKEIHNNLAATFTEMFGRHGMVLTDRRDFVNTRTMGSIHPNSLDYRERRKPVESVLCFQK